MLRLRPCHRRCPTFARCLVRPPENGDEERGGSRSGTASMAAILVSSVSAIPINVLGRNTGASCWKAHSVEEGTSKASNSRTGQPGSGRVAG